MVELGRSKEPQSIVLRCFTFTVFAAFTPAEC